MCKLAMRRCMDYASRLESLGEKEPSYLDALETMIEYFEGTACEEHGWTYGRCESFWEDAHIPAFENVTTYFTNIARMVGRAQRYWRPVYDRIYDWLQKWFSRWFSSPDETRMLRDLLRVARGWGYTRLARFFADVCSRDPECPTTSVRSWRNALVAGRFKTWFLGVI